MLIVKCPYCEHEESLEQWEIHTTNVCKVSERGVVDSYYLCEYARCPVCDEYIELHDKGRIILRNEGFLNVAKQLKNAIENERVNIDDKRIWCGKCRKFRPFYTIDLVCVPKFDSSELQIEIGIRTYAEKVSLRPSEVYVVGVKCSDCGAETEIDPLKVDYPISDKDRWQIFNILKEKEIKLKKEE